MQSRCEFHVIYKVKLICLGLFPKQSVGQKAHNIIGETYNEYFTFLQL